MERVVVVDDASVVAIVNDAACFSSRNYDSVLMRLALLSPKDISPYAFPKATPGADWIGVFLS